MEFDQFVSIWWFVQEFKEKNNNNSKKKKKEEDKKGSHQILRSEMEGRSTVLKKKG